MRLGPGILNKEIDGDVQGNRIWTSDAGHCERSEAISACFKGIASSLTLLAMTNAIALR